METDDTSPVRRAGSSFRFSSSAINRPIDTENHFEDAVSVSNLRLPRTPRSNSRKSTTTITSALERSNELSPMYNCQNSRKSTSEDSRQFSRSNSRKLRASSPLFGEINELRRRSSIERLRRHSRIGLGRSQCFTRKSIWAIVSKNPVFEGITLFVISLNAVWIGIDTDHNDSADLRHTLLKFLLMENFFCFYFTWEVVIRFLAYDSKRDCLKDFWFKFDSFLVTLMIVETWVFPLAMPATDSEGGGGVGQLSILRLLRLLRLTRMARLMRALPSLVILLKGMRAAARSVFTTLVLLLIIVYMFGIVMTMQIGGHKDFRPLFNRLGMSMSTLFLGGTLLDDVTSLLSMFKQSDDLTPRVCLFVMFLFILISSFTVLNMLIGVLCEVATATKNQETESADWQVASELLTTAFQGIDEDGTGTVSQKEFLMMTEKESVLNAFEILAVEPKHLIALSDALFEPDEDATVDKELSFAEFLDVVWSNRPGQTCSVLDLAQMQKTMRRSTNRVGQLISRLHHCACDDLPSGDSTELDLMLEKRIEEYVEENDKLNKELKVLREELMDLVEVCGLLPRVHDCD